MKLFIALIKIIVDPFYQKNTGFFLFFFFLFFGTVDPNSIVAFHLSIIQSILTSLITLSCLLFLWTLYNYKCTSFVYKTLKSEEGQFIYLLQALSDKRQLIVIASIQLLLLIPLLIYIATVLTVAIKQGLLVHALLLLLFSLTIWLGSSFYYASLINKSWKRSITFFNKPLFTNKKPRKLQLLLLHYMIKQKLKQLLLLKLLSFSCFYIALVWNHDKFNHDSLVLFLVVILTTHSILPFQFVQFFEKKMLFIRNLPLNSSVIFIAYYIAIAFLFLPELVYLIITGNTLLPLTQLLAVYFCLVHTLLIYTAVQYSGKIDQNEYVKIIFGISFISIFFFNKESYWSWGILLLTMATLLFFTNYKGYEALQD
jgi:hypothetical protein